MFVKVDTVPNGAHDGEVVPALVLMGPGCMVSPVRERGLAKDRTKLVFPDGRAVILDHSLTYMEALLMGEHQRPGLTSDVDAQMARTGKQ